MMAQQICSIMLSNLQSNSGTCFHQLSSVFFGTWRVSRALQFRATRGACSGEVVNLAAQTSLCSTNVLFKKQMFQVIHGKHLSFETEVPWLCRIPHASVHSIRCNTRTGGPLRCGR